MNGERAMYALMLLLALSLPLSALLRRRVPGHDAVKLGLLWAAIIVGLMLAVRVLGLDGPHNPIVSRQPISFT